MSPSDFGGTGASALASLAMCIDIDCAGLAAAPVGSAAGATVLGTQPLPILGRAPGCSKIFMVIFGGEVMEDMTEYQGEIRLGSIPWEVAERLVQFRGNWLEFIPQANAIVFRRVQPMGCPALTGVPCELITMIDSIPPEFRDSMPGGELSMKDQRDRMIRCVVRKGEIRIRWPQESCLQTVAVSFESAAQVVDPARARVTGWARFAGASARGGDLRAFVDRFGGLYPAEDMPSECEQNVVYVRFKDSCVAPGELIACLQDLADPLDSLQAELEVDPSGSHSHSRAFTIRILDGRMETAMPALQA
jgi:hypothetical protein